MARRKGPDPATAYAEEVLAGRKVAGRLVRLACERHIRDLESGKQRGLRFNRDRVDRLIQFFSLLKHSKGEWAGQPFSPEDWQRFILASVSGWEREDGTRRFRVGYVSTARKSGKSTLAAGVGLYGTLADGEPGAECYSAATKRDQARITHGEAVRMVLSSPELKPLVTRFKDNLSITRTHSKYEPLGADADTLDGLNIHFAIMDEVHAWKGRDLWDVIETATGARRQPLLFAITTAGHDRTSLAWELHDYSTKILEGILVDDSHFAFIATLDEGDDWQDERVWVKANPNLNISVKIDSLREQCEKAKQLPSAINAFRRLRCNEWTESHSAWLDVASWDACGAPIDPDELENRPCFGGLDLASTIDITAFTLLFPDDNGGYDLLNWFWVPEESIATRSRRDRVKYDVWAREGYLETTEGNVCDYDVVREKVRSLSERYQIKEIAYDRWNASQLVTQLQSDGATMVPVGLGFASMASPTREFEKLVISRKLRHGNHPVMRWMVSNVSVKQDPAGNRKPDRAKSTEKIDGVISALLALSRAIVQPEEFTSIYEKRGVVFV